MATSGTGGLLQGPVPAHGGVSCTATTTVSPEATTFKAAAFLLVASGIKNLNLSDAVALC